MPPAPPVAELYHALKEAQLEVSRREEAACKMQDEINNLRNTIEQLKTAGAKRTCRGGRKKAPEPPSSDIEPATTITHIDFDNAYVQRPGKMYMVIGEPWITPRPEMALNQPRPDVDYGDPQRYRNKTPEENLPFIIAEIYHHVPEGYHVLLEKYAPFREAFIKGFNYMRSSTINTMRNVAPVVFKVNPEWMVRQTTVIDRAEEPVLLRYLKWNPTDPNAPYDKMPPLLFPDCIRDPRRFMQNPQLVRLLSSILFGEKSALVENPLDRKAGQRGHGSAPALHHWAGPPTNAVLWGLKKVTLGLIAFGAIAATFLLSADEEFTLVGSKTQINYWERFQYYKKTLMAKSSEGSLAETFRFYQERLFPHEAEADENVNELELEEDPANAMIREIMAADAAVSLHDHALKDNIELDPSQPRKPRRNGRTDSRRSEQSTTAKARPPAAPLTTQTERAAAKAPATHITSDGCAPSARTTSDGRASSKRTAGTVGGGYAPSEHATRNEQATTPHGHRDGGHAAQSRSPASRNMNPRAGTQGKRNLDHSSTTHPLPVPQASRWTVPASSPSPIRFSPPAPADVELRDVEAFDVSEAYNDQDDLETGFDDDSFDHSSEDLATQSDGSDHEDEDGAADHSRYGTPGYGQAEGHPYRSPSPDSDYANDDMIVEESEEALEEDYDEVEYIEINEDDQTDHGLGPPTDSSDEEDVPAQRTNFVHAGDSTGAGAPRNYSHRLNGPPVIQSSSSLLLLRPGKERPDTFRAPTHPPVRGPTPFSAGEDVPRPTDLRSPEVDQAATADIIGKATKGGEAPATQTSKGAKATRSAKAAGTTATDGALHTITDGGSISNLCLPFSWLE
ncbi:hypothetical protein PYCCODRAFT_1468266 [Trametes coccinea BRFM310]|uniref:Uncharacterized protein n=1 Tax=Trametes coccinea (strain BRFM310) TaxID=1353009 RepID=A0A1Y2IMT9_TRAC3|nr:hypothetical protein PYCCODRAFT_1468266 [Trametes coccinea BRFM310]